MIDAVEAIEDLTHGMDKEDFRCDTKTKSAVVRQFEILGEAAKAIPVMMLLWALFKGNSNLVNVWIENLNSKLI